MKIEFIEIQNFRRLKSCRIDFDDKTTVFVGANNSGKTSAMAALYKFLVRRMDKNGGFSTTDFTLSNWSKINDIGKSWEHNENLIDGEATSINTWEPYLPSMDVWLEVADNEIHHVAHLIPTLDWKGGLIGVRLRVEPQQMEAFIKEYCTRRKSADTLIESYCASCKSEESTTNKNSNLQLWPKNMREFLDKQLRNHFTVNAYTLDPSKLQQPENGVAIPQVTSPENELMDSDPLKGLILINSIMAQRGFSDPDGNADSSEENNPSPRYKGSLSSQLRSYYDKHINPAEYPDLTDMEALGAIETAQQVFDERLRTGFKEPLSELQCLGYPGLSDPCITISTKIKPIDGLNHDSAVQYELIRSDLAGANDHLRLPEQHNGLGYQNLISMVFQLMRFRDQWMKVGKIAKKASIEGTDSHMPPLHLVLIEEPEAHLHVQVQQVFIRKSYGILRKHADLGENRNFTTQLIVSTHSSHIAHETEFLSLRYFRRKSSGTHDEVPISTVVNLSDTFGEEETQKFAVRYLKSTHCDLFFADAAIIVEGPAERMLVPHFIHQHFRSLDKSYISLLEIGGSHAHRLKPLIEKLGLVTLIITDIDAIDISNNGVAVQPERGKGYETGNSTIKDWVPAKSKLDDLLDLGPEEKIRKYNDSQVRVSYQHPITIEMRGGTSEEALPYTFEDALVFDNLDVFRELEGIRLIRKFKEAINRASTASEMGKEMFDELRKAKKAEFALDLFFMQDPAKLKVPTYIADGLSWLDKQISGEYTKRIEASEAIETENANAN